LNMSNRFSGSMGLHKLLTGALVVAALVGTLIACVWVVQKNNNSAPAHKLFTEAMHLLARNQLIPAVRKLEEAEKLQAGIIASQRDALYESGGDALRLTGLRKLFQVPIEDLETTGLSIAEQISETRKKLTPWSDTGNLIPNGDGLNTVEMKLFTLHKKQGSPDAIAILDRAVALYSFDPQVFLQAGQYYEQKDLRAKLQALNDEHLSQADVNALSLMLSKSLTDDMRRTLDGIIVRNPKSIIPLLVRINYLNAAGGDVFSKRALADAELVIRLHPELPEGYNARALTHSNMHMYKESFADLSEALKRMPACVSLLHTRADVAKELKMNNAVLADLDSALEIEPLDVLTMVEKANFLGAIGDLPQAQKVIENAVEVAKAKERLDSLAGVHLSFERAGFASVDGPLVLDIDEIGLRQGLARLKAQQRNYEGALLLVEDLIRENPSIVSNHDLKADICVRSGDPKTALAAGMRALELQKSPVQTSSQSIFPQEVSLTPPVSFTSEMSVTNGAIERYERLATIYDALGDSTSADKQRRNKLSLLKLKLYREPANQNCLTEVIEHADRLDEYRAAIWAVRLFSTNEATSNYRKESARLLGEKLLESNHRDFAFRVINEFSRLNPGDAELADLRARALKRCSTKVSSPAVLKT
jgi:tetratricopeptide (TPR) repeat protein